MGQVVLEVLPWSRPYARLIYRYLLDPIRALWVGFLGIVPSLFYLAVIALTTYFVLRVVRFVFKEIQVGNIRLASFPDDWAEPTYKLVRALLVAVAFVGAFPYIPGSQSPRSRESRSFWACSCRSPPAPRSRTSSRARS